MLLGLFLIVKIPYEEKAYKKDKLWLKASMLISNPSVNKKYIFINWSSWKKQEAHLISKAVFQMLALNVSVL